MRTISTLEFRKNAAQILRDVARGQRVLLTYRGKPMVRMEPVGRESFDDDDPLFRLTELTQTEGKTMTNREMDEAIYGA